MLIRPPSKQLCKTELVLTIIWLLLVGIITYFSWKVILWHIKQRWNIDTSMFFSKQNTSRALMRKRVDDPSFQHGIAWWSLFSSRLISLKGLSALPFITKEWNSSGKTLTKRCSHFRTYYLDWEISLKNMISDTSENKQSWKAFWKLSAAVVRSRFSAALHHLRFVSNQYRAEYKLRAPMKSGNSFMQIATWYLIMPLEL